MGIDSQLAKTVEMLAEKPLEYEYEHPIEAIERAVRHGLAVTSEPRQEFINGKWRSVCTVSLPNGSAA